MLNLTDVKNEEDFEGLYKELQPKILNYIAQRVNSQEDAEDIASEVFIRVYKNIADFKWQGISINAWVYRIAKNAIIDYYRKNSKDKKRVDFEKVSEKVQDNEADLLSKLVDDEERRDLYIAISQLPPEEQYLLYYKYFEDLSLEEIAKRMDLSDTNVGTKLHRLRKKLLKKYR